MSPSPDRPPSLPTSAFDYALPAGLIARYPAERRDESRLMVVDRATGSITDHIFRDLPDFVPAGDAVVLNETRVFPARLVGRRAGGGEAEVLLLRPAEWTSGRVDEWENPASARGRSSEASGKSEDRVGPDTPELVRSSTPPLFHSGRQGEAPLWEALVRPGARLRPGKRVVVAPELAVEIVGVEADGTRVVRIETPLPLEEALERYGRVPLPPYIDREPGPEDAERYQTVYARARGSVAAPTAGLHFTPAVLESLETGGARLLRLVLHVGPGTFRPVEVEDPAEHRMHAEWYQVGAATAAGLEEVRARGGRVWAVGTTVARTLESAAEPDGMVRAGSGWTRLFIRPPYRFQAVDRLLTNFHLPRSTLLMLVAAFAGRELVLEAYRQAVERRYRFYSYGDAMLVL